MKKKLLVFLFTLAVAGTDVAQGAYTGIFTGGDAGYAIWDNFTSPSGTATFSNLAPTSSNGVYSSSLLGSTTNPGAFMSGGGDRIYGFFFIHELTLSTAYVDSPTNAVMLQVVLSEPGSPPLPPGATGAEIAGNYFTMSMNGTAPTAKILLSSVFVAAGGGSTYYNWAYIWNTPTLANGAALNFVLDGFDGSQHVSLDAVAISAAPEPSRAVLLLGGLGCLLMRRKRRKGFAIL